VIKKGVNLDAHTGTHTHSFSRRQTSTDKSGKQCTGMQKRPHHLIVTCFIPADGEAEPGTAAADAGDANLAAAAGELALPAVRGRLKHNQNPSSSRTLRNVEDRVRLDT
jgi:hypothetical protein